MWSVKNMSMSTEGFASFQQIHIQEDINSGERCMAIWLVCYYIRRIHHLIDVDCSIVRSNNYIVKTDYYLVQTVYYIERMDSFSVCTNY